ncbi:uncharacterized protein MEPE_03497 [Melanopsichium pennsylvanicum]|uniref:Uncharacterized protein n=1 Tax=Melanopsichium pennsylvanicum TaxID=63383 RepID=A0AAJ4XPJ2_9BASI|nr:uncharacterized protein MEPE_03497 [Melanopsichium pennsylvanicum]
MPATRTRPKDVLIRVPKVEPYSNRYVSPSVRAKEEAKAAAEATTSALANATVPTTASPVDSTTKINPATTVVVVESNTSERTTCNKEKAEGGVIEESLTIKDRLERENSPTLPFLSLDREEEQTVELSKAATSSAGWNSLLIWARRQRGAQWDSSTALWQVEKHSQEYYTFGSHPNTTDRSNQPCYDLMKPDVDENKNQSHNNNQNQNQTKTATTIVTNQNQNQNQDQDKASTRISSRNKTETDRSTSPLPPTTTTATTGGRTVRLVRRNPM